MLDNLSTTSETHYLEAIRKNDREALKELYASHFPAIKQFIIGNSGRSQEAHDVFQEGLIVLYRKAQDPDFSIRQSFRQYLFAVCKQIWFNELRKKRRQTMPLEQSPPLLAGDNIEETIHQREKDKLYRKCFQRLGKDCQQILQLFFDGISMKKIVEQLGFSSVSYAKKRKFQCKERLLKMIQGDPLYAELTAQ